MIAERARVSTRWLALREPADAAARARVLVDELVRRLPVPSRWVIHDLGCGTGAMGRWLAPLLPGPQHWVLHDLDPDLLRAAGADPPGQAADGAPVTVETRQSDISRLGSGDLGDATLITASALLDLLTPDELSGLAGACMARGCPVLLTLSVVGRVQLAPAEPLDRRVAGAFDAHQRRTTDRGGLLGPDAPAAAIRDFGQGGAQVIIRDSPWRLGASHADLAMEWFAGWLSAACEQDRALGAHADGYRRRRVAQATARQLAVTVDHTDLLVLPRGGPAGPASPRR